MEQPSYKLEIFEGPMDLLLHLISKHKLNINDIPIIELVNQYLDYVRKMQEEDFDIAGEFLEMAARLMLLLLHTPRSGLHKVPRWTAVSTV